VILITVEEIDELVNGEFNYAVSGHYLNEYMLEPVPKSRVTRVHPVALGTQSRDVDLGADGDDDPDEVN
jgi:hypothetical protein